MSGSMSRNKGGRVERLLVKHLRDLGWTDVSRIPLRGSYKKTTGHCKPDVIGFSPKARANVKFEVKARKDFFNIVYDLMESNPEPKSDIVIYGFPSTQMNFALTYNVDCFASGGTVTFVNNDTKVLKKVTKMHEWLGESDLLAIKGDHKPFIFIRYFNAKTL